LLKRIVSKISATANKVSDKISRDKKVEIKKLEKEFVAFYKKVRKVNRFMWIPGRPIVCKF
jgi:hypothetical protein